MFYKVNKKQICGIDGNSNKKNTIEVIDATDQIISETLDLKEIISNINIEKEYIWNENVKNLVFPNSMELIDDCSEDPKVEDCKLKTAMYYYNSKDQNCNPFYFVGCGGMQFFKVTYVCETV